MKTQKEIGAIKNQIINRLKRTTKSILLLFAIMLIYQSCIVTDDEAASGPEAITIADQTMKASLSTGNSFKLNTTFYTPTNAFNKDGYMFYLYDVAKTCENKGQLAPIKFFLTKLEVGAYTGDGPFFDSTSYAGCDVIITKITSSTVEGRVKGGNPAHDQYLEGRFVANICPE